MKVALVIGGTGMLSEVTRELATRFHAVGVVGRTDVKMNSVTDLENVCPLRVDYSHCLTLSDTLKNFTEAFGKADLIVSWIHATSPDSTMVAAQYCQGDFYEVTGSTDSDNYALSFDNEMKIRAQGINYHRVTLGSINGRWLTDEEISGGVLEAIDKQTEVFVIGET